jgi:RNA polymerase subunit RPABC4/transcription elongation factor Spt4
METTCTRCHQSVLAESCYCPVCGLPQLVYNADGSNPQSQPERWNEAVRDAATVDWKPALRAALMLAIPAGLLSSMLSPLSIFGLPLMAATGAWAVVLYVRSQRPAWITVGAGARIGLVTGVLGGWIAAASTGATLFAMRFWFHQGGFYDDLWQNLVNNQMGQQWQTMGVDPQSIAMMKSWLLPPEGRAGWLLAALILLSMTLLLFSIAGGAIGARITAKARRPSV